jgi:hypothetical protein
MKVVARIDERHRIDQHKLCVIPPAGLRIGDGRKISNCNLRPIVLMRQQMPDKPRASSNNSTE